MPTRADTPTAEVVLDVLRDAVATVLEIDPRGIGRGTAFSDLEADSLALVEVAEIVEERLAPLARQPFRFPDSELEALVTVGEAVDYALARL